MPHAQHGSLAWNLRAIDLVFRQHPGLTARGVTPFIPGRQRHHGAHIGAGRCADLDCVGVKSPHDRRKHRVGGAKLAKQECTISAVLGAAFVPNGIDTCNVLCGAGVKCAEFYGPHHVHRQVTPQRHESGVHLGCHGTSVRPCCYIL